MSSRSGYPRSQTAPPTLPHIEAQKAARDAVSPRDPLAADPGARTVYRLRPAGRAAAGASERLREMLDSEQLAAVEGASGRVLVLASAGSGKTRTIVATLAHLVEYKEAATYAKERGIIIADTKFEFGVDDAGVLYLIDEALTPDSSRFWPADQYQVGTSPPSFDKQYIRDYLETLDWNKTAPGPSLPMEVAAFCAKKYREAEIRLTQNSFK